MTQSIRVAILDDEIAAQLRERPEEAAGFEVAWSGTSLDELMHFTAREPLQVIVADLERLGPDPASAADRVLGASGAELFITVYKFAPRRAVEELVGEKRRVVKAPLTIGMLRTQMMGAIVRGLLASAAPPAPLPRRVTGEGVGSTSPPPMRARSGGAPPQDRAPIDPPMYSDAQLGSLRERQSRIACECPNHVAEIVSFERYSRACASRDDDDAAMHRALASATGEARRVMERALADLLRFEGIVP